MAIKRINILFLLSSLEFGGAQRQVVDLINGLSDDVFKIHLLTFEKQLDLLKGVKVNKIHFYHFPRRYKFDFSVIKNVAKVIREKNIDIVHSTNQLSFLFGLLGRLRARSKTKFALTIHTTLNKDLKNELFDRLLYAPLMTFCHVIITVCNSQKLLWAKKYPWLSNKFITIYNGIDMERYKDTFTIVEKDKLRDSLGVKSGELLIAILAVFRPEKGHEFAFRALKKLIDSGKKIKLLLIGDGERKIYLEKISKELKIGDYILWLGFQKDPRQYLSICDVLLVPSVESFSISMLEALAMGKPVIATELGGSPEMLKEGMNGFLLKPKDADSIVEKLSLLISDPGIKRRLSSYARESVEKRFSVEGMVAKTSNLLSTLAAL